MTCEWCGRDVTLMDGHFCGQCSSQIAAAVGSALGDVSGLGTYEVNEVYVNKDGDLIVSWTYEGAATDA